MKRFIILTILLIICIIGYAEERNITSADTAGGVLTVPQNTTLIIPVGDSISVKSIVWPRTGDGSKGLLRVDGVLTLDNKGNDIVLTDPKMYIVGSLYLYNNSVEFKRTGAEEYFSNAGFIYGINDTDSKLSLKWTGDWDASSDWNHGRCLDLSNSHIKTDNFDVYIHANNGILKLGTIEESNGNLDIDRNGGSGETTAESLVVDGTINLQNAAMNISVYDALYTDNLNITGTYNSVTITCKPGSEVFVKNFEGINIYNKQLKFSVENGGVISLCKNPNLQQSDYSWGKLVTLSAGAVFNYIVSEYYKVNYSNDTTYTNPKSEGDVELENGVQWTSDTNKTFGYNDSNYGWDDFRRDWRDWYYGHRQQGYAYIVGTYSNQSECQSVYETKKMNLLPIELTKFEVTRDDSIFHFNWETASEENCDRYVVEASFNGREWIPIGEFLGAGTTSELTEYQEDIKLSSKFISNNVFVYFRLHEYDYNNSSYYSDVVAIQLQYKQSRAVRCNILGQYSQSGAMIEVYNGELRFIKNR